VGKNTEKTRFPGTLIKFNQLNAKGARLYFYRAPWGEDQ